jgi:ABC-type polysaccharide/polyol phosphate export permease
MQNVGTVDRIARIVVGVVLIALVFVGPQTPWGWIGVIPLATALIGFCPAYKLFGLSTCPVSPKKTA